MTHLRFGANGASSRRLGHAQASLGATLGLLHFFNACVIFLQALHRTVAVAGGGNSLHGVVRTGERCDVRHLVLDASRPWLHSVIEKCKHFSATLVLHTFDGGLANSALEPSAPKCGARK